MSFFTKENITLLISILGACAWLPIIVDKIRKPEIECKILKSDWLEGAKYQYNIPFENGLQKEINGNIYVILLRCISLYNDFVISGFKVKVKYESMSDEVDAYVHFSHDFTVTNLKKEYNFDLGINILYCPVLRKDVIYDLETHFIVENTRTDVEYMKFIFERKNGKSYTVIKGKDDFKYALKVFV